LGLTVGRVDEGRQVEFAGHLSAEAQSAWYARAQWWVSLPQSDSVAVSLLEAMAHGCIPLLSDLPANREWVRDGENGLIVVDAESPDAPLEPAALDAMLGKADSIAADNRAQVARDGLFAPAVARFLARLQELSGP
jgi:glycosyltransferase involved in cell wall biosynthesis